MVAVNGLPDTANTRTGRMPLSYQTAGNMRKGFVCKRVRHVTLKLIANNAEIDTIHERWQPELNVLRAQLNRTVGRYWKEWGISRETAPGWPETALTA